MRLWGDPIVTRFISAQPLTETDIRERLDVEIATQTSHGMQYWPIFRLADGTHIGCCGLRPRPLHPQSPELGVHVLAAQWRRGYATEASSRVVDYAFGKLGCHALFAGHNPENGVSANLLARLGFVRTHEELYKPTGRMHPSYLLENVERSRRSTAGPGHRH